MKVTVESAAAAKEPGPVLRNIPNGTFFMGAIGGTPYSGPYLKIGSVSENHWVVARVSTMEGAVWVSSRDADVNLEVEGYHELDVIEVVLRTKRRKVWDVAGHSRDVIVGA